MYYDAAISHKKIHVHDPKRNLTIFNKMVEDKIQLTPREQFYYARELYYNKEYTKSIHLLTQFLDSKQGWVENNIEACLTMFKCYKDLPDEEKSLHSLFRSFQYDSPRAEICCEIGNYFFNKEEYKTAIFWYEIASSCKKNEQSGGFVESDCYDYIPYIQLCVCYYRIGDREKSILCNDKAGKIKPEDKGYLYNKQFFKTLK